MHEITFIHFISTHVPVDHIWKFDLEEHETRGFGMKFNFSKIRMEPFMLSFIATTENIKNKIRTTELQLRKSCQIKTVGNCYSHFPSLKTRVELSYLI